MRIQVRFTGIFSAAAALLLACAIYAPTPVRASCGDYLHRLTTDMPGQTHQPMPLAQHEDSSQPGHCPCSGPNCSGRSQPVPQPPLISVSVDNEHAVCVANPCPPPPDGMPLVPTARQVHSVYLLSGIYHPPRLHAILSV